MDWGRVFIGTYWYVSGISDSVWLEYSLFSSDRLPVESHKRRRCGKESITSECKSAWARMRLTEPGAIEIGAAGGRLRPRPGANPLVPSGPRAMRAAWPPFTAFGGFSCSVTTWSIHCHLTRFLWHARPQNGSQINNVHCNTCWAWTAARRQLDSTGLSATSRWQTKLTASSQTSQKMSCKYAC